MFIAVNGGDFGIKAFKESSEALKNIIEEYLAVLKIKGRFFPAFRADDICYVAGVVYCEETENFENLKNALLQKWPRCQIAACWSEETRKLPVKSSFIYDFEIFSNAENKSDALFRAVHHLELPIANLVIDKGWRPEIWVYQTLNSVMLFSQYTSQKPSIHNWALKMVSLIKKANLDNEDIFCFARGIDLS